MRYSICNNWEFTQEWSDEFLRFSAVGQKVRLPHTCKEIPLHYADSNSYQMICGYRRMLTLPDLQNQRVFLQFDGAAHIATLYINGKKAAVHRCGYTAFRTEITDFVHPGDNQIAVCLDTTENPVIPPFGLVIDYLTYGGLYREAWLDIRNEGLIDDVFVTTPSVTTAKIQVTTDQAPQGAALRISINDPSGHVIWEKKSENFTSSPDYSARPVTLFTASIPDALFWNTEHPHLYTCICELLSPEETILDHQETTFGFRTAEFRADGFYLNGEKTFLRGLNRHQCYPYVGYAASASLQREDVRILQEELGCNAVRTSHYPQSQHFLNECDRRGMLVFTEIPGWQHIGDTTWQKQAVRNTREMILQNRNHPSIILWGVRINESQDDDEFYKHTNALAHRLDPSRATSGVRYIENSHLLEDVYAYNDFSHNGITPGAKPKKEVSPDKNKALLISEHNGHMFPTKAFDPWEKKQEHALRHGRVLNAAYQSGEHTGCFGWCMFDYPTHKDFGSGDRVCYHGVMDAFRNPKPAAALYASQQDHTPVLEVVSSMDIGDYPAGQIGDVAVFSNADEIRLYKNDVFVTKLHTGELTSLPHPPFVLDDTVGELLETQEGFSREKSSILRECLLAAGKYTLPNLPARYKAKLLWCMMRYHMTFADGVDLYGKYIGNWGGEATRWRFDAVKDGKVISSVTRSPSSRLHLDVRTSTAKLAEADTYDMAAVRVRILDENDTAAPFAQLPVHFSIEGDAELIGPSTVTAEGGMCGTMIRTVGHSGEATLTVSADGLAPVTIKYNIAVTVENESDLFIY